MRYRAQMIGQFQSEVGGAERLVKIEKTLFLKTKRGDYIGLFPIDRIAYDAEMVEKLKVLEQAIAKQVGVRSRQLWIGGPVEPEAMAVLTQRGWKVYDRQFDHHLKEPQGDAVKK